MDRYFLSIRWFFPLLAAGVVLLAAGCGDTASSDSSSSDIAVKGDSSLNKAKYIEEADATCLEGAETVKESGEEYVAKLEKAGASRAEAQLQLPAYISGTMIPLFEEEIDKVSSLSVPKGDEKAITEMLETFQRGLEKVKKAPQSLFGTPNGALAEASQMGRDYGFSHCGSLA